MSKSVDFLCDLWMSLFQFVSHESAEEEDCIALVEIMDTVEKTLIAKLQSETPDTLKIMAILTGFGSSELPRMLDPLLKAYSPCSDEVSYQL
ncbi:hypothetical protein [Bartonella schoenbuchensis]|uniref:Uncharacterized protein n=1 Tax=Bartonella schoenbuchensis (strain DSM 13525 / NCTC 13165 / R1) TaxID=687861 RepID=E6YZP9_BARSR|nr:hypothetical protein [Bartonella schoenbuchensis]AQX30804.1 hypothetical protein BscR1v2_008720 [Bartonella schoenbuchensis R1]CBI82337.1 conserved hypothetical protein [Bartonella schoenbuchensis R1]